MSLFQKFCPAPFPPFTEGSGFEINLGGLPMSLVVLCARGMCSILLLLPAFELWCWRWLFRVCWTARRSNQSILNEISPEYSFEGLILKLKLQYFGHLMWRTGSFERTLMLEWLKVGGEGGNRGWYGWMASSTQWTWVWVSSESWWWTGKPGVLQSMGSQRVGHDWATELNWTDPLFATSSS